MFGNRLIKFTALVFLICASCTKLYDERAIAETTNNGQVENIGSSKLVAELPIKIDSSKFIMFPVRELESSNDRRSSYKINKGYRHTYKNFIFKNIDDQKTHLLFSENLKILNFSQLSNDKNEPEKVLLYQIIDKDFKPKEFEKISLYLSSAEGKNFTKISPNGHHLKDWKYISAHRNVYFNTLLDANNDGKLDDKDDYFSFYVSIDNFKINQLLNQELKTLNNKN